MYDYMCYYFKMGKYMNVRKRQALDLLGRLGPASASGNTKISRAMGTVPEAARK